jgi:TPR repeat protein
VDLHAGNRLLDSQLIRLEWIQRPAAETSSRTTQPDPWARPRTPDAKLKLAPDEIAMLVRRARQLLTIGDISAARLVLRRAANAGNAQAALLLGSTYDPSVLKEMGAIGVAFDAAQARQWYRRAAELGSTEAPQRIERLAVTVPQ